MLAGWLLYLIVLFVFCILQFALLFDLRFYFEVVCLIAGGLNFVVYIGVDGCRCSI